MNRLRFGAFEFRPRLGPSLMALAGCSLLFGLAVWQTGRAVEKQALQAQIEHLQAMPALQWQGRDDPLEAYRKVRVTGRYRPDLEVLLDNRVHQGRAGYHVITPLQIAGDTRLVAVNRGWVPVGRDRSLRPETPAPQTDVELTGFLARPTSRPVGLSAEAAREASSGDVWPYLDLALLAARAGVPVASLELRLDPDLPSGFVREWPRADTKVGMHVAYALQWAAFGVIALITYLYVSVSRREPTA